jgi:hypothetical protein
MGKVLVVFIGAIFILGISLFSKFQIQPLRNKIVFEDKIEAVADSMERMHFLLEKIPITGRVNYFMDREGNLYISNEKIGSLKGAINNPTIREDVAFEKFTNQEINDFFNIMAFLYKNHIDAANLQNQVGEFLFTYRRTDENTFDDLREIMIVNSYQDTVSSGFKRTYQVLDKKSNLLLVAPKSAKVW